MPSWPSISLSSGFTHVSDTEPDAPEEGATWYDLGDDRALVYDGATWHRMAVEDHTELSGVSVGQHRSDSNIRQTVDGQVDAETVDGKHASDLGAPTSTNNASGGGYWTSSHWSTQSLGWEDSSYWQSDLVISRVEIEVTDPNGDDVRFYDSMNGSSTKITGGGSSGWFSTNVGAASRGCRVYVTQQSNGTTNVGSIRAYVTENASHDHSL